MGLDENLEDWYGTIEPQAIKLLERATRNDDGSIRTISAKKNIVRIQQQRSATDVTPPAMTLEDSKQQPHQRLPLKMIISKVAHRADEGTPASLPLQEHRKRVSTLDELFLQPPNMNSKKGRIAHPKHVVKSHQQPRATNTILYPHVPIVGKQIIGEIRKYSSLYGCQNKINKRDKPISGALHAFEEPLSSTSSDFSAHSIKPNRLTTGLSKNGPRVANIVTASNCSRPLPRDCINKTQEVKCMSLSSVQTYFNKPVFHSKHLYQNSRAMVDFPTKTKLTLSKNIDTRSSYKPPPSINSECNKTEEPLTIQHGYTNQLRTYELFDRNVTQPVSPITEVDTTYSSSSIFIKTANCLNKEFVARERFRWEPKLLASDNWSNKKQTKLLERATRNDDGSICTIPANLNIVRIQQQRSATDRTPPAMTLEDSKQQPHQRLPLKMIISKVARRPDEGTLASLPLQKHQKRVSTLDELFLQPPNMSSEKGNPKHVDKSHKQTLCKNIDTRSSYKPSSTINSECNKTEKPLIIQHGYTNQLRTYELYDRNVTQPVSPITEVDTTYSPCSIFIKTANCLNKEFVGRKKFHWEPKLLASEKGSNMSLEIFLKEQSVLRCDANKFCKSDNIEMSGRSDNSCSIDTNQLITNFNYQITEFSVSLGPEDERETTQGSVQEFDTESVLSNSDHSWENSDNSHITADSF